MLEIDQRVNRLKILIPIASILLDCWKILIKNSISFSTSVRKSSFEFHFQNFPLAILQLYVGISRWNLNVDRLSREVEWKRDIDDKRRIRGVPASVLLPMGWLNLSSKLLITDLHTPTRFHIRPTIQSWLSYSMIMILIDWSLFLINVSSSSFKPNTPLALIKKSLINKIMR